MVEEGRDEVTSLSEQPPDVVQRLEDSSRSSPGLEPASGVLGPAGPCLGRSLVSSLEAPNRN